MGILFDEARRVFLLSTDNVSYGMEITGNGVLCAVYWGPRLGVSDLPTAAEYSACSEKRAGDECFQEYPGWGGDFYSQHALKATAQDGSRNSLLRYRSHRIDGDTLKIELYENRQKLAVTLTYVLRPELDIIDRSTAIANEGDGTVTLESAFSALLRFPAVCDYRLTHLSGAWAREYQIRRMPVQDGLFVMETRTGLSGPEHAPVFMMDDGSARENAGGIYFGTLQWSGNFKIQVEKDEYGFVSVLGGISDLDFAWPLKPGESFETPVLTVGYTLAGFGEASRKLHRYQKKYLMRMVDAERVLPVIVNAYGTFFSNINEEKILGIIDRTDRIGAEAFLIDAGWYGVGDFYTVGMGDWTVNKERFPHGLRLIADRLHEKGLLFGLWLEPEAAHPESRLLREHPDWALQYGTEPPRVLRERVMLNFALEEVYQDILQKTIAIIEQYHVDYYKMDLNRLFVEWGSPLFPSGEQKTLGVRYVRNLYRFYGELASRFPNLLIENCAGGGRRVDLGMTAFSGRINRSDDQDPLDVLRIHEGFTYFMLSKFAGGGCHISKTYTRHYNHRDTSTRFQAHVGMMGSLAIGENLAACTDAELDEIAEYVSLHKKYRHITQLGDVYRLASAVEHPYAAFEYVLPDAAEAVLFVYGQSMQFKTPGIERLRLEGLEPDAVYSVAEYGERTGRGLMNAGLQVYLTGDMDSKVIYLVKKVNDHENA